MQSPKKIVSESLTMMVTAFGLVAALAWNEAIKALIDQVLPKGQGLVPRFIYAVLVTVLVVVASSRFLKIKSSLEGTEND